MLLVPPKMADSSKRIRVVSGDQRSFLVDEDTLRGSEVAACYLDTFGVDDKEAFPFPAVNGDVLSLILDFCKDRKGMWCEIFTVALSPAVDNPSRPVTRASPLTRWSRKLMLMPTSQLIQLLRGADYCSVKELYALCCEALAKRMEHRTPDQLKKMLGKLSLRSRDDDDIDLFQDYTVV